MEAEEISMNTLQSFHVAYFYIIYEHTLMTKVNELNINTITFDDVKLNFQWILYFVFFDLFEIATNCAELDLSNPSLKKI